TKPPSLSTRPPSLILSVPSLPPTDRTPLVHREPAPLTETLLLVPTLLPIRLCTRPPLVISSVPLPALATPSLALRVRTVPPAAMFRAPVPRSPTERKSPACHCEPDPETLT